MAKPFQCRAQALWGWQGQFNFAMHSTAHIADAFSLARKGPIASRWHATSERAWRIPLVSMRHVMFHDFERRLRGSRR